ncbi:MAG: hypothetical protein ACR2IJ_05205 [Fluviibacter sp.]
MTKFYTSYSFTIENEDKGFTTIQNMVEKTDSLSYKMKTNPHEFGSYRSIEIFYNDDQEHDSECDDEEFGECLCTCRGLEQAQALERDIQEKLQAIL